MLKRIVADADENMSVADTARAGFGTALGAVVALIVVHCSVKVGVILPDDRFWMNELIGLPMMILFAIGSISVSKKS